jgi:hypothetical protein
MWKAGPWTWKEKEAVEVEVEGAGMARSWLSGIDFGNRMKNSGNWRLYTSGNLV